MCQEGSVVLDRRLKMLELRSAPPDQGVPAKKVPAPLFTSIGVVGSLIAASPMCNTHWMSSFHHRASTEAASNAMQQRPHTKLKVQGESV